MKTIFRILNAGVLGFTVGYFYSKDLSEKRYVPLVEKLKEKLRTAIRIMREDEEWFEEAFGPVTNPDKEREELLHYEV